MPKQKTINTKKLLAQASKPAKAAIKMHAFYRGKMQTLPRCVIRDFSDFAVWYTPGVAEPCKAINKNPDLAYEYTSKWNTIAVVSDGTRVLGLGDIGPEAAMPVMEGKAMLFKYLGGVDCVPICLDTKDPQEIIRTVKLLQPSFGGINLEDISQPKCFDILDTLRKECRIPVWHDDQQGTATVTVAGLINALKVVNKKISAVKITMIGAGAANICIAKMIIAAGADPGNIIMCDTKGTLHKGRTELELTAKEKWDMCMKTNRDNLVSGIPDAIKGADVLIALSTPGPGVILPDWIKTMTKDSIVFVCANPVPEIWPWEAKAAGARVVATGRSDFPNQVNNSLGFPGIFRGVLDVRATTITDEMCIAAATELAKLQEELGLDEDHIIPTMDNWEVFPREAVAVGMKAIEQGIAKLKLSPAQIYNKAKQIIKSSRDMTKMLMKQKFIAPYARSR
jgi:malate dehydrogenase (oxaloacetate-decarboxylating)